MVFRQRHGVPPTLRCTCNAKVFLQQWAKIVIALERAVSQENAKVFLYRYSVSLGGGGEDEGEGEENLGVMVIKCKDKTKAKQRKGALSNWKVSILALLVTNH